MAKAGNPLRKNSLSGKAIQIVYRWVALSFLAACFAAPKTDAQDGSNVPVIRVEAHQVLIPVFVTIKFDLAYCDARRLTSLDFHLFEDNKEQKVIDATLLLPYGTRLLADNQGYQFSYALTPRGEWTYLGYAALADHSPGTIYVIAYQPPESPEGSCHTIKVKVNPKSESGNKMTTVELGPLASGNSSRMFTEVADRRNLLLDYRTQYCNVLHAATDPLFGTQASERMESAANSDSAEVEGFYVRAVDFYDESNRSRERVALDFVNLSRQSGYPEFNVALLGMFNRTDGTSAVRFSDSAELGCRIEDSAESASEILCGRDHFYNHYETEVDLPPGDYDLRVAIDFGGALRRAEVPVHIRTPDKGIDFTPTAETRFNKKDPLAAYFELYEPLLAGGGNVHVQFEMRVVDAKTGEVKSDTGFKPADEYLNPGKAVIPISQQVAIGELSPGDYRLQVRAMDSSGNSTDWRTTSFTRE
jgi:hypothetical protein